MFCGKRFGSDGCGRDEIGWRGANLTLTRMGSSSTENASLLSPLMRLLVFLCVSFSYEISYLARSKQHKTQQSTISRICIDHASLHLQLRWSRPVSWSPPGLLLYSQWYHCRYIWHYNGDKIDHLHSVWPPRYKERSKNKYEARRVYMSRDANENQKRFRTLLINLMGKHRGFGGALCWSEGLLSNTVTDGVKGVG